MTITRLLLCREVQKMNKFYCFYGFYKLLSDFFISLSILSRFSWKRKEFILAAKKCVIQTGRIKMELLLEWMNNMFNFYVYIYVQFYVYIFKSERKIRMNTNTNKKMLPYLKCKQQEKGNYESCFRLRIFNKYSFIG